MNKKNDNKTTGIKFEKNVEHFQCKNKRKQSTTGKKYFKHNKIFFFQCENSFILKKTDN